ncbi:MAG: TetR/AcrR family transcriptional regulator [Actinomycetaceae bacterium]|nr:TetR/AcrR family transcriptional regulator [Actinomycetaceae bacterium]
MLQRYPSSESDTPALLVRLTPSTGCSLNTKRSADELPPRGRGKCGWSTAIYSMTTLRKKTGPKPGFSREDVIRVALDIGIADFTLARIAKRLNVRTPALYRVITSRDDVLQECLERMVDDLDLDDLPPAWDEAIREFAKRLWNVMAKYPGLARVLQAIPGTSRPFSQRSMGAVRTLVDGGLNREDAMLAADLIGNTVIFTRGVVEAMEARQALEEEEAAVYVVEGTEPLDDPDADEPRTTAGIDVMRARYLDPDGGTLLGTPPGVDQIDAQLEWMDRKIDLVIDGLWGRQNS